MTASLIVPLRRGASGEFIDAQLTERVDIDFARRADTNWQAFFAAEMAKATNAGNLIAVPEHDHWRWELKVAATAHLLSYPTFGLECDGDVQGLMLLQTDGEFCRLSESTGSPLVYVMFLASAPWNVPPMVPQPRFRGVGTLLMRAAVEASIDLGFKGRVGLHSLHRSESWYDRIGMTDLGSDGKKQGLKYYEMNAAAAAAFLS